jgi:hypothetical protein
MGAKRTSRLGASRSEFVRVRPELKGTPQLHQQATPEEISDGIFFENEAAYQASRAA